MDLRFIFGAPTLALVKKAVLFLLLYLQEYKGHIPVRIPSTSKSKITSFNGSDLITATECFRTEVVISLIVTKPTDVNDFVIGQNMLQKINFTVTDSCNESISTRIKCNITQASHGRTIKFSEEDFLNNRNDLLYSWTFSPKDIDLECNDVIVTTNPTGSGSEYVISPDTTWQCAKIKTERDQKQTMINTHHTTSLLYPTSVVSCVSLISSIVTLRLMSLSNATSGNSLMHTMINSLFLYVLLITSFAVRISRYKFLCLLFGIFGHFFALSIFSHLAVGTVNLTINLMHTSPQRDTNIDDPMQFRRKFLFSAGYILPMLIITPCVGLELWDYVDIKPGYTNSLCIAASHLFVTGPGMACVLASFASLVILKLKSRSLVLNEDQKMICSMFAKVTLVTFFLIVSWFTFQITQEMVAAYVFLVVFGLHGFCFFLCFCNKRILNNCRGDCCVRHSSNIRTIQYRP